MGRRGSFAPNSIDRLGIEGREEDLVGHPRLLDDGERAVGQLLHRVGEIFPLLEFDVDEDPAAGDVQHFREGRDPLPGEARIEPEAGIEAL